MQTAKFSVLAAAKFGMPSPCCRAELAMEYRQILRHDHWSREAAYFAAGPSSHPCGPKLLDFIAKSDDSPRMTYAGGKGRLWQNLVSLMPPHDTYIETHLGGGAVMCRKRPARRNIGIDIDPGVISSAAAWDVPDLTLCHSDAVDFLRSFSFAGSELVYADPPYVASTKRHRRYYRFEYTDEDHRRLLEALLDTECQVMISGYDCELYDQLLTGWHRRELRNITHAGPRTETVWANFAFSAELHDYGSVGCSFRERERIKRKALRWVRNLDEMPELERRAILAAIADNYDVAQPSSGRRARSADERVAQ